MSLGSSFGLVAAISSFGVGCLAVTGCSSSGASGPCRGSLSELARSCPATFSGALENVACVPPFRLETFSCEGLAILIQSGGYLGLSCVYDSTTHVLIGAQLTSDVTDYCKGTSFTESAGTVPSAACIADAAPRASRDCPAADGGGDL
jgi:hypothetical protein